MEAEHQQFRAAWGCTYRSFSERQFNFIFLDMSFICTQELTQAAYKGCMPPTRTAGNTRHTAHRVGVTFGKQVSYPLHNTSQQSWNWWQLTAAAILDPGVPDLGVLPSLHKLRQVEKENHLWNNSNRPEGPISSTCIITKLKAGLDREGRGLLAGDSVATTHIMSCWWPIPKGKTLQQRVNNWNRWITELINLGTIGCKVMGWSGGDRPSQQAERSFQQ